MSAPAPLLAGDTEPFTAARARGASYREAFEALLFALPPERADALTQLLKESRGAWFPLLRVAGGEALVAGNSLTGSVLPLAAYGFRVTLLDPAPERLALALARAATQVGGVVRGLVGGSGPALPFADASFDLVVLEGGLGASERGAAPSLAECRRVTRGELFVMTDNRFGYKRSSGRYRDLRLARPLELLKAALRPRDGERSLRGYRRLLASEGFAPPRAFALYAHRRDFAYIVALDAPRPALTLGPSERRNRIKTAAHALGLFPLLAPSFAFVSTRSELERRATRGERVLAELSKLVGEPTPEIEALVGTRGNTTIVQTARPGVPENKAAGRWTLHVPMYQGHAGALDLHLEILARIARDFPGVPVPAALFAGVVDGVRLTCERRLPGLAGHHLIADPALADRVLAQVAEHFAALVTRPARTFDARDFETLVAPKFELVLRRASDPDQRATLTAMQRAAERDLPGLELVRVLRHSDLRAKHVQLDRAGRVLGYLDWGTAVDSELPLHDLLHLYVHDRKQQSGITDGEAWRVALEERDLRPGERRAFELYGERCGLTPAARRALTAIYPVVVGHTAESNWPYTRPGWFRKQFGL